uniref:Glycosyl transferase, group 1 n=1 Tax=Rhodopseudomonas palustris (strain BisA53) TaxID=316055 RepID=Q07II1_RHOP5
MRIVVAVFQLTALGGKERDCLATARCLADRGHEVIVLTTAVADGVSGPFRIVLLPVKGSTNHSRNASFARDVLAQRQSAKADVLVAFDRVPGADFFFAADHTYTLRYKGWSAWLLPRRRMMLAIERGLFDAAARTRIFFLTARQRDEFLDAYGFDPARGAVLPLILHEERYAAAAQASDRAVVRQRLGVPEAAVMALCLGIPARRKGFDRAMEAIVAHPNIHLVLAGSSDRWVAPRVKQLKLQDRVHILPYGENVMDLLTAADIFLHPAREEAAGIVIGEALLAGAPVIVSSVCGYAPEVARSGAGIVLPEPFRIEALRDAIGEVTRELPTFRQLAAAESARLQQTRGHWLRFIADRVEEGAVTG